MLLVMACMFVFFCKWIYVVGGEGKCSQNEMWTPKPLYETLWKCINITPTHNVIHPVSMSIYLFMSAYMRRTWSAVNIIEWFWVWVCVHIIFLRVSIFLRTHITPLHLFVLSPFSHTLSFTESQRFAGNSSGSGSTLGSSGVPVLLTSTGKCIHQLISQMTTVCASFPNSQFLLAITRHKIQEPSFVCEKMFRLIIVFRKKRI